MLLREGGGGENTATEGRGRARAGGQGWDWGGKRRLRALAFTMLYLSQAAAFKRSPRKNDGGVPLMSEWVREREFT